jgi:formamidase
MMIRVNVNREASVVADPANSHNRLWPDLHPVAVLDPGEELVAELRDGMDGGLGRGASSSSLAELELDANHPLTGPIEVRGARPGDVLVVELLELEPDTFGATAVIPGFGLLGDRFEQPYLVHWEIAAGVARSTQLPGVAIRGRPFLGCVAVAPSAELLERATRREAALAAAGGFVLEPLRTGAAPGIEPYASRALRTIPPRENGGNLDLPQFTVGSRLLLPVHVPGALLSLGDAHFAQGEGECCGTAIEVAATAKIRVGLRAAEALRWHPRFPAVEYVEPPRSHARAWFATSGIPLDDDGSNADLDLTLAARRALEELVSWLHDERGLTREQGYVLASVAADLSIAEGVNVPNGLVSCRLPLDVFEHSAPKH